MKHFAFYGKGGVGKSTIVSNLSVTLARMGYKVMQIGCDPKADSTMLLRQGQEIKTVLDVLREKGNNITLEDLTVIGTEGIVCVEAGGPTPGMGCAGRGIIHALEKLGELGAYEVYKPDVILYDVLGDVVCGGFTMPMRGQYSDQVMIITSQDKMSIYAAGNIAMAVDRFKGRGYAKLGGFIENHTLSVEELSVEELSVEELSEVMIPAKSNKSAEHCDAASGISSTSAALTEDYVATLAQDFNSEVLTRIPQTLEFRQAERENKTLVEMFPESDAAKSFKELAELLVQD